MSGGQERPRDEEWHLGAVERGDSVLESNPKTMNALRDSKPSAVRSKLVPSRKGSKAMSKGDSEYEEEEVDLDFQDQDEQRRSPFYKKARFWKLMFSICFTVSFAVAAAVTKVKSESDTVNGWFETWRLFVFLSTLAPIFWAGSILVHITIWVTEVHLFAETNILFFIYSVRKPLANILRSMLLMASWAICMYDQRFPERDEEGTPASVGNYYKAYIFIIKLLGCVVLFFLVELVKVFWATNIGVKFNRDSHMNKMRLALKQERYLHDLLEPRPTKSQDESKPGAGERFEEISGAEWDSKPIGQASRRPNASSRNLRRRLARQTALLSTFERSRARRSYKGDALPENPIAAKMARVEKHIRKESISVTFYDKVTKSVRQEKVTNENEAKRLAFFLFHSVKEDPDRTFITIDDLRSFFEDPAEAQDAFSMLDKDGNGRISITECAAAVENLMEQRKFLASSLKGTQLIVSKLATMIGIGLHVVCFFIYLFILGLNAWQVFVSLVPILTAISFALGSSAKTAADNTIFLFVVHPYDVGDLVFISGTLHRIEDIRLNCTVAKRITDFATVYFSNAWLATQPLQNASAPTNAKESITVAVNPGTVFSVIADQMVAHIQEYVIQRPRDFTGEVGVFCSQPTNDLNRPNQLMVMYSAVYKYNRQHGRWNAAHNGLVHFVLNKLAELNVEAVQTLQPVEVHMAPGGVAPTNGF